VIVGPELPSELAHIAAEQLNVRELQFGIKPGRVTTCRVEPSCTALKTRHCDQNAEIAAVPENRPEDVINRVEAQTTIQLTVGSEKSTSPQRAVTG
jgi:hypothetical protein